MKRMYEFKSQDKYFHKERIGLKPNTIREIDLDDERFVELITHAINGFNENLFIKIVNVQTGDVFMREITDITWFKNMMIISWKHLEEQLK